MKGRGGAGPRGMKGHKGMQAPKPPMGSQNPSKAPMPGAKGGAVPLTPPKDLKQYGHPTQTLKSLSTDRGAFRLKG